MGNRRRVVTLLCLVLWPVLAGSQRASAEQTTAAAFRCDKPGPCFQQGEPGAFELVSSASEALLLGQLRLVDYDNQAVHKSIFEKVQDAISTSQYWKAEKIKGHLRITGSGVPPGFYIAQWIPAGDERVSAYLRFVVIPVREYFGLSPFGMDAAFSWFVPSEDDLKVGCQLLRAAGVDSVRDRISWSDIQPERNRWTWGRYDSPTLAQYEAGMQVYQVFQGTAPWAVRAPEGVPRPERYPPHDLNDLSRFLQAAVSRYADFVQAWEVWNEMDSTVFFAGTAEEYAAILQKSYGAIKSVDPGANVLLGSVCMAEGSFPVEGTVYTDTEGARFLEKVLECGGGRWFDTYNFHYYGPVDGLLERFSVDHAILQRYGQDHKPVWLTEIGLTSDVFSSSEVMPSEKAQADYLVKAYTLALSLGVEKVFFFFFPTFLENEQLHWGIYDYGKGRSWSPKPAYAALAYLTHTLREGNCLGQVVLDEMVRAVLFETAQQQVAVLWSLTSDGFSWQLPEGKYEVRDLLGRPVALNEQDSLVVTASPLYLTGDLGLLLKGRRLTTPVCGREKPGLQSPVPYTVLLRCEPNVAAAGDRVRLSVQIYNETPSPRKGEILFRIIGGIPTSRWIPGVFGVEPYGLYESSFDVDLLSSPAGEYQQRVLLFQEEKEIASAASYLKVVNPIQVTSARLTPTGPQGKLQMEVAVENRSLGTRNVLLEWKRAGHSGSKASVQKFNLDAIPAGVRKTFRLSYPSSAPVGVKWTLGVGDSILETYLDEPRVYALQKPPKMDGKPEWEQLPRWHLWKKDQCVHGAEIWKGMNDLSGQVAVAISGDALYLTGSVLDDDACASIGAEQPWTGDAVELFFDLRTSDLGKPSYGDGVFQLFLAVPSSLVPQGRLLCWQPSQKEITQAQYNFRMSSSGYDFELLLPLSTLGLTQLQPGQLFALDVVLDDRDRGEGLHKQMVWQGTGNNWRDPSGFPKVIVAQ